MHYVSVKRASSEKSASCLVATSLICTSLLLNGCGGIDPMSAAGGLIVGSILEANKRADEAAARERAARNKELDDTRIGYQSIPVTVPQIGELRLNAFPLNAYDRRGLEPFVICLAIRWKERRLSADKPQTISIDPKLISLVLPDGSAIKPTRYAVAAIYCPYTELANVLRVTLEYQAISFGEPLVLIRNPSHVWGFLDLALQFDVATPGADQKFSLELGPVVLDGVRHDLPTIDFQSHQGEFLGHL